MIIIHQAPIIITSEQVSENDYVNEKEIMPEGIRDFPCADGNFRHVFFCFINSYLFIILDTFFCCQ